VLRAHLSSHIIKYTDFGLFCRVMIRNRCRKSRFVIGLSAPLDAGVRDGDGARLSEGCATSAAESDPDSELLEDSRWVKGFGGTRTKP
jgi:hypothetical protein